ncbi:MAG TPA: hypothetical protein VLV78_10305 [Thermoanaerobaculia bacterium]|nr:hypothetical protein [Thermoanaerobaculia bacterium]
MRWLALLLLSWSCSSSSDLVSRTVEGGPGQPITVDIASVDNSVEVPDPDGSRQYTLQVEVGNSTDTLLTVTRISVRTDGGGAFQVYPTVQKFNELLDPGKDHLFEIKTRGRFARQFRPDESRTVVLLVIVELSNGDSYSYTFEGPVKQTP